MKHEKIQQHQQQQQQHQQQQQRATIAATTTAAATTITTAKTTMTTTTTTTMITTKDNNNISYKNNKDNINNLPPEFLKKKFPNLFLNLWLICSKLVLLTHMYLPSGVMLLFVQFSKTATPVMFKIIDPYH